MLFNTHARFVQGMSVGQTLDITGMVRVPKYVVGPFAVELVLDRAGQDIVPSNYRLPMNVKHPFGAGRLTKLSSLAKGSAGQLLSCCVQVMKVADGSDKDVLTLTISDDTSVNMVRIDSRSTHDSFASGQIYFFENIIAVADGNGCSLRFNHNSNYILEPDMQGIA